MNQNGNNDSSVAKNAHDEHFHRPNRHMIVPILLILMRFLFLNDENDTVEPSPQKTTSLPELASAPGIFRMAGEIKPSDSTMTGLGLRVEGLGLGCRV